MEVLMVVASKTAPKHASKRTSKPAPQPVATSAPMDELGLPAVLPALCTVCDGAQLVLVHINVRSNTKTQRCRECGEVWESDID
jgi:hypothetical protein